MVPQAATFDSNNICSGPADPGWQPVLALAQAEPDPELVPERNQHPRENSVPKGLVNNHWVTFVTMLSV
jgi:hypothetical protein